MNKTSLFVIVAIAVVVFVLLWVFVGWTAAGGAAGAVGALAVASKKARERIDKEIAEDKKQTAKETERIRAETNGLVKKVAEEQDADRVRANARAAIERARATRKDLNLLWVPLLFGLGLSGCAHQQHQKLSQQTARPAPTGCTVLLSSSDADLIRQLTMELEKTTGTLRGCKKERDQARREVEKRKTQTTLARAETLVGREQVRELRGQLRVWMIVGIVAIMTGVGAGVGWGGSAAGWW